MSTPNRSPNTQGAAAILWLVWVALFFSLLIFASVSLLIPAPPEFTPIGIATGAFPPLIVILGVATVTLIPTLLNARKRMFFTPRDRREYATYEAAETAYFTMSLTSWIFCEVVGVFGLLVAYLTFDPALSLPFVVVATVLFGVFHPRPSLADAAGDAER